MRPPDAQRRPDGNRTASRSTGQVDYEQGNRRGAALGAFREQVDPTLLAAAIAAHLEAGFGRIVSALAGNVCMKRLENLHSVPMDDQTTVIRLMAGELLELADIFDHTDEIGVAA